MSLRRRVFLQSALAAGAGLALGRRAFADTPDTKADAKGSGKSGTPLKILILGGTGFLGPACMDAALSRGHTLTLFNRGRLETIRKDSGRAGVVPEGVEVLYGNRDPEKFAEDWKDDARQNPKGLEKRPDNPKGLTQLQGRKWDAVIDTSAYFPRIARASAELLAPNVKQYVFVSTLSVYADTSKAITESTPTGKLSDPASEDFGAQFENYGPGKAACEEAIEKAMPGRVTNVRPGFIVGPRDSSNRFLFYPIRVRRGGEMVLPGSPEDPIQIIDVRDLGAWIVKTIEDKTVGIFNATGPAESLTMKKMVEGCRAGAGASTTFSWETEEALGALGNGADGEPLYQPGSYPLYVPPAGEGAGFHKCDCTKAIAKGLTFRSVEDTARTTLAWYDSIPAEVQKGITRFPMSEEKQDALLAAWKASKKK